MSKTLTKNKELLAWVEECKILCEPDAVVWIDGSAKQKKALTDEALKSGEIQPLDPKIHPGCYYHRTALNDVARVEDKTFICQEKREDVGATNNWKTPADAYTEAKGFFKGSMKGRKMYVIPFSMGPVGSPLAKYGVELSDSIYVVLNMFIMTRVGKKVLDVVGDKGVFTKCLHGKAEISAEKRRILHFPKDNAIWSVNSGYGGNVLLGKKCLALRIASYLAWKENWLAEHMLILGVQNPKGETKYVAAAFPSACGKTNLAMLVPPKALREKGYKVWTVGDDISWMRVNPKTGMLHAINPEAGFFGVAPGTNAKTNPNALASCSKNTIFTNVLYQEDKTVWWEEGQNEPAPDYQWYSGGQKGTDWTGKPWAPGQKDAEGKPVPGANPNSRFTAPAENCPCISPKWEDLEGVPISAFIFGGRRAHIAPLVYQSFNWTHGVFVGGTMASERTAAQYGKLGEVRRDPMAMLPFCGYNMGDYFAHWLKMGQSVIPNPPKIFHVNWFKRDKESKFLWPGFGENLRVLLWVLDRCEEKVGAKETPIGFIPNPKDLRMDGLDLKPGAVEELFSLDLNSWKEETALIEKFFEEVDGVGGRMPKELKDELENLRKRLG